MASGDLLSATVLGTDPFDGWVLQLTIAGWTAWTVLAEYDAKIQDQDKRIAVDEE